MVIFEIEINIYYVQFLFLTVCVLCVYVWGGGGGERGEGILLIVILLIEQVKICLRWLPPVLHFPEPLNFTKGFLAHYDGLVPVLARWCYNSF